MPTTTIFPTTHPVTLIDSHKKYPLRLIEKRILNHDTRIYRFALPSENHVLGVPVGQHVRLSASIRGKRVMRKYTPVSLESTVGYVDLLIKVYFPSQVFLKGGKMTRYIDSLKIGDTIDFRGPKGRYTYLGNGSFSIKRKTRNFQHIGMIAGGSGIAPLFQILQHVLANKNDPTTITLIFANKTAEDIVLRNELDSLAAGHPGRFSVHYTLDLPPEGWDQSTGFVDRTMITIHLPTPSPGTAVFFCGPKPMNKACFRNLSDAGHSSERIYKY